MTISIGQTILEKYRVDEFVGKGGMASVYKIWDLEKSVSIAMKVLNPELAEDKVFLRRFTREAQTLATLQHPNIIRFYGIEQDGEDVFITMDFIEGITLRKHIFNHVQPFSTAEVLEIMTPVCAALNYAHKKKLIHCDVKPANIMIDLQGKVYLSDFGISRISEATTATMVGAGTPAYMAPEQILGKDPLPQTDIYALGIVMYEMLTGGERPFTGERAQTTGTTAAKVRWEQLKINPLSPSHHNPLINREMDAIVLRCLGKDPDVRYANTMDLLAEIQQVAGHDTLEIPTPVQAMADEPLKTYQTPPLVPIIDPSREATDLRTRDANATAVKAVPPPIVPTSVMAETPRPFNKWLNGKFAWLSVTIITLGWAAAGAIVWKVAQPYHWWIYWGIGEWALTTTSYGFLGGLFLGLFLTFTLKLKVEKTIKVVFAWAIAGFLAGAIGTICFGENLSYFYTVWNFWTFIGALIGVAGGCLTCFILRQDLKLNPTEIAGITLSWIVGSMLGWYFYCVFIFPNYYYSIWNDIGDYYWYMDRITLPVAGAISGLIGVGLTGLILNRNTTQGWKRRLSLALIWMIFCSFGFMPTETENFHFIFLFCPLAWFTAGLFTSFVFSSSKKKNTLNVLLHTIGWGVAGTAAFTFCTLLDVVNYFLMWIITAISLGLLGTIFDELIDHGLKKMNWKKITLITSGWALGGIFAWVLDKIFGEFYGMDWIMQQDLVEWIYLELACGALLGLIGGYLQSLVLEKYPD